MVRNLRYWHAGGIRYVTYETKPYTPLQLRWPMYHLAARGLWDPKVTSDEVMTEACSKLYGPAAGHMFGFYKTLEKAMVDTGNGVSGGNWSLPTSIYWMYTPQVQVQATEYLQAAAAVATATADSAISQRVALEQQMWETAKAAIAALP